MHTSADESEEEDWDAPSSSTLLTLLTCVPRLLCTPLHRMHSVTPRFQLAQVAPPARQSAQRALSHSGSVRAATAAMRDALRYLTCSGVGAAAAVAEAGADDEAQVRTASEMARSSGESRRAAAAPAPARAPAGPSPSLSPSTSPSPSHWSSSISRDEGSEPPGDGARCKSGVERDAGALPPNPSPAMPGRAAPGGGCGVSLSEKAHRPRRDEASKTVRSGREGFDERSMSNEKDGTGGVDAWCDVWRCCTERRLSFLLLCDVLRECWPAEARRERKGGKRERGEVGSSRAFGRDDDDEVSSPSGEGEVEP
mgnify:CR=1 FL=1